MSSGGAAAARTALRDVWTRFPPTPPRRARRCICYADLATDDGDDAEARALYQQLYAGVSDERASAEARASTPR